MAHLAKRLPPLRSLVAFEASARHLSLTRAAQELGITREAVSQHIRSLEDHLGVKLFERQHGSIALTAPGVRYHEIVQTSLESIANATGTVLGTERPEGITIATTIALASFWLTPRLAAFRVRFDHLNIHVRISDAPTESLPEDIDVALRYGDGNWKGFSSTLLFDVSSFPVCSPGYLKSHGPLTEPKDLLQHTLVNLDGVAHMAEDWRWWMEGFGVRVPRPLRVIGFDSYANVIQAAVDGQGVALGFTGILDDLLACGRLVRPIRAELSRGLGVYVAIPRRRTPSVAARGFVNWIAAEAAKGRS